MKFCAQCGERLDDASAFCSRCGAVQPGFVKKAEAEIDNTFEETAAAEAAAEASVISEAADTARSEISEAAPSSYAYGSAYQEEPRPVKKRRKGWIIAAIIAAALLLSVGALAATGAYASLLPHSKLKLGIAEQKFMNRSMDALGEQLPVLQDICADLDLSFNVDAGNLSGFYAEYYGQIYDVINNLELYTSIDTRDFLDLSIRGDYKGNTAADLRLFVDKEQLGLYVAPADDKLYTMSKDALVGKIAPDMDPAKLDFLFEKIDREALKKDLEALKKIVADELKKAEVDIEKNVEVSLFGGEKQEKGAVYTITLTEEQITEMLIAIADYLESEDCYIAEYAEDVLELLTELEQNTDADIELGELRTVKAIIGELRENIPDIAKEYVDAGYRLEAVMKGNEIIRQRFYNDEGSVGYDSETVGKSVRYYSYFIEADKDTAEDVCDFTLTRNGNTLDSEGKVLSYGDLVCSFKGSQDMSKRSVINTYAGEYEIIVTDSYEGTEVKVDITVEPKDDGMMHHITAVTSGEDDGNDSAPRSVSVDLFAKEGSGVEVPAGVKTEDMSDYSDMKLITTLYKIVNQLSDNVGSIFN